MKTPPRYWTLERLKEDALKYNSRSEWQKKSSGAYSSARKQGLTDECCAHMQKNPRPRPKWSLENLKEDALKYNSRSEWRTNSNSAYATAYQRGLLDECCAHMTSIQTPSGYWTIQRIKEDALNYKSRSEWQKKSRGAYSAALSKRILDECCSHMNAPMKTALKRCIYRIYAGNEIYIGLSYNAEIRFRDHKTKTSQIIGLIERYGIDNVTFEKITDYIDQELAQVAEKEYIEYYRNNGWIILNRAKAGGLGGSTLKWSLKKLKKDALKYKSRSEWRLNSIGAYSAAHKRGLLDECCAHMESTRKESGYWTIQRIKEDALNYKSRSEWKKKSRGAFAVANQRGMLDECCAHMKPRLMSWSFANLKEDALRYKTRNEWRTNSKNAYSAAKRLRLIDECCGHMPKRAKRK
ncbi:hypothetical protein [Vibrio phage XZ1]|nr:hypothetical protein [Vibrio phage XZ1]